MIGLVLSLFGKIPQRFLIYGAVACAGLIALHFHDAGLIAKGQAQGEAKIKTEWEAAYVKTLTHAAALQTDLNQNAVTIEQVRVRKVSDITKALAHGGEAIQHATDEDALYRAARNSVRELRLAGGLSIADLGSADTNSG